jgi:hypothetical protein
VSDNPRRSFLKCAAGLAAGLNLSRTATAAPEAAPQLPAVRLGSYEITRLLIGANPFAGFSHVNRLLDQYMLEWATMDNMADALRRAERNGINTWQFSHGPKTIPLLKKHRDEGGKLQAVIVSERELEQNPHLLAEVAKLKPVGIVHHGGRTDSFFQAGEHSKVLDFVKRVKDLGVMAGVSTHNPRVVQKIEELGWTDVDFYMTAVYQISRPQKEMEQMCGGDLPLGEFFMRGDAERMYKAVRQTKRTCLVYKILAASRLANSAEDIDAAFKTAYASIKPGDCVIVGMYTKFSDQVSENAARVRKLLARA